MSLFGIGKKLYKKDLSENISEHELSRYNPEASGVGNSSPQKDDVWVKEQDGLGPSEKKTVKRGLTALIIILASILALAIIFEMRQLAFNGANSRASITGPTQIASGQMEAYEITYKNNNWVRAKDAVVRVTYPENFKPEPDKNFKITSPTSGEYSVGSVRALSSGKIIFRGKAYSPKGALIYLKADFVYQPFSYVGKFNVNAQLGVNVAPAPLKLEIQGPQSVVSGNSVDYAVKYQNNGSEVMDALQVRLAYSEGFNFVYASTEPSSSNDNVDVWEIGSLKPGESGMITVKGRLVGTGGMTRMAKASIGVLSGADFMSYNDETQNAEIVESPLFLSQIVNGVENKPDVSAGDHLQFKIKYKNTTDIGLRQVIVTEKLDSPVLDYTTLSMKGGSFDAAKSTITWKAADIPEFLTLGPGQSGEIDFAIDVKRNIPLDGKVKKNFVIVSLARIDSPDVPTPIASNRIISSNEMDIKLNSKIILETQGFYNDATIVNSGPMPPRVGQETTYTMHWKVMNVSNDINNAVVTAFLPTNATATGKFLPDDARVSYNERTNSISWNIGKLDAGTGVLNSPPSVAFQIKIKPSIDKLRNEVNLLGVSTLTADDLFTGEKLTVTTGPKNTNLVEDQGLMKANGSKVVE